jgi:uncharacterized YigZ family protein
LGIASLQTIKKAGVAEQTINKSRFFAHVAHCETEAEVGAFFRAIAVQHASASHLAYAFRIKTIEGTIQRFSDAGEPSGTAGKPILQILESQQLINVAVGVIRYYGGVNLGTGGLSRAYGGTASLALQNAIIAPMIEMQAISFSLHYNQVETLLHAVKCANGVVLDKRFDSLAHISVRVPVTEVTALRSRFS